MRSWEGVAEYINSTLEEENSRKGDKWREQFIAYRKCSLCGGSRLK
jgi:excinuclease ABC subunit A